MSEPFPTSAPESHPSRPYRGAGGRLLFVQACC